jgi:glycine/D-amino acid oxidase-like deaminating enzyme
MPRPWADRPTAADRARYAGAHSVPYWLDALPPRDPQEALNGTTSADLCIIGGGFTGLWAAVHAKRQDPERDIVLLEAATIAYGASGRNGGFVASSLTHGLSNGLARFADEIDTLERLGRENLDGMEADIARHGIDCGFERTGTLSLALEPHEEAWAVQGAATASRYGYVATALDEAAARARLDSPLVRAALLLENNEALVDPARLAAGLLDAALTAGVRVHEHSAALRLHEPAGLSDAIDVATATGRVRARKVLIGTSAFPPLLRRISAYIAPVYDYVLMTEPLTSDQKAAIGWAGREGVSDMGNQFHYMRLTADDRILIGGYDAVYRYGGPVGVPWDEGGDDTFAKLSEHFATFFPQLADEVRFSHKWGGAIDTCSRFSVFFGTAHRGKASYAVGYTGLGVGATRFGAQVALDLVDGVETEATRLRYVRSKPLPFPPEPLRSGVIQLTRNRLAAADRNHGQRGRWLRTLDRLGLGFDS